MDTVVKVVRDAGVSRLVGAFQDIDIQSDGLLTVLIDTSTAFETSYWLCQTNANQVEFVIPGFRWTAQNTCDFQQPLGD